MQVDGSSYLVNGDSLSVKYDYCEAMMKRLQGIGLGRIRDDDGKFECDKIIIELDHGRTITITRDSVAGDDGIAICAGIERKERTANGRFVVRVQNFGHLHLSIEQAK
jgi:hypothetical protein